MRREKFLKNRIGERVELINLKGEVLASGKLRYSADPRDANRGYNVNNYHFSVRGVTTSLRMTDRTTWTIVVREGYARRI